MKTRVSSKGQIVLPAELRQQDRIAAGQEFEIERLDCGDYRLKPSSPALRSGSTEGAPAEDIEDRSRSGSGIDIGAYQSAVGPRSVLATR